MLSRTLQAKLPDVTRLVDQFLVSSPWAECGIQVMDLDGDVFIHLQFCVLGNRVSSRRNTYAASTERYINNRCVLRKHDACRPSPSEIDTIATAVGQIGTELSLNPSRYKLIENFPSLVYRLDAPGYKKPAQSNPLPNSLRPRKRSEQAQAHCPLKTKSMRQLRQQETNSDALKLPTLYFLVMYLIFGNQAEDAEEIVEDLVSTDPHNSEAILCWCLLRILQGHIERTQNFARELVKRSPNNPYYRIALAISFPPFNEEHRTTTKILFDEAYACASGSYDALAKLGVACCFYGYWSLGIRALIDSAHAIPKQIEAQDELTLFPSNEVVNELLLEIKAKMDGLDKETISEAPLPVASYAFCLLLACQHADIPEALLPQSILGVHHKEISSIPATEQWKPLFENYCKEKWHPRFDLQSFLNEQATFIGSE